MVMSMAVTLSCGSVNAALDSLIGLVTCFATHDGIPDVGRGASAGKCWVARRPVR
jgi:hypothetical protein